MRDRRASANTGDALSGQPALAVLEPGADPGRRSCRGGVRKPYAAYVQERILTPLGLTSTTPELPEGERGKRLATGYSALSREHTRTPVPFYQVRGIAPAAGFASTVEDLARFASWQLRLLDKGGREVLSAETLREMQRPQWIEDDWQSARGLGFALTRRDGKTFVGHGGNCPGFLTQLCGLAEGQGGGVVFVNAQGLSPSTYSQTLYDIVPRDRQGARRAGQGQACRSRARQVHRDVHAAAGGRAPRAVLDGELVVMSLPSQNPVRGLMKLKPESANVFRRVRDDGGLAERVVFELGPNGQVVADGAQQ